MAVWRYPQVHATTLPREDRRGLAVAMMFLTYACFTALDSSAKYLVTTGTSPWVAVFARYLVHLAIVAALVLPARGLRSLDSGAPVRETLRAVLLLASTYLNFTAIQFLPLTLTSTIFFAGPIFVCLLSIPILGERVRARRWIAIGIGFVGILIVTRPWTGSFHWAMLLSVASTLCGALYQILTRMLAGVDSANTQQLYAGLIATLGAAPIALMNWHWPEGWLAWTLILTIGVFGWLGHQLLTVAHRYAPASFLAPFVYVQLIYMSASSWLIFSQPPTVWILAGAPIIMASGFYIWWRERQLKGD